MRFQARGNAANCEGFQSLTVMTGRLSERPGVGDLYLEGHRIVPPAFLMTNLYFPSFAGVTFTEHFGPGESSLPASS